MSKKKARPSAECLSIIICEDVIEDARSHNKTIVNAFNQINALKYPVKHDRLTVFLSLTSGRGEMPLEVVFGPVGGKPIVRVGGRVTFPGPRAVVDLVFSFRGLTIPQPGEYEAMLYVEGEPLCRRRVTTSIIQKPEGKQP